MKILPLDALQLIDADIYTRAAIPLLEPAKTLLKRKNVQAAVLEGQVGRARLVNLLAWDPSDHLEYLDNNSIEADQVLHFAMHQLAEHTWGSARAVDLITAEALASAVDIYLLGKLAEAGEEPGFLIDTLDSWGFFYEQYADEDRLKQLLQNMIDDPFASFQRLTRFLIKATLPLLRLNDGTALSKHLAECEAEDFYPLLHHYNVTNWVLAVRARGLPVGQDQPDPRLEDLLSGETALINAMATI